MGTHSKFWGAVVGGVASILVNRYALPPELATVEIQGAIALVLTALTVRQFPANK